MTNDEIPNDEYSLGSCTMARLFEGTPLDRPPRCERCGELEQDCQCPPPRIPPHQQTARLAVEKRRKGKLVTLVRGLAQDDALPELLTELKTLCGAGGTLKDGDLEIQGSHQNRIRDALHSRGYRVK